MGKLILEEMTPPASLWSIPGAGAKRKLRKLMLSKIAVDPSKGYIVRSRLVPPAIWQSRVFERKKHNAMSKQAALARILSSRQGLNKLAKAMASPLMRNLDYKGVMRSFVKIEKLPE